MRRTEESIVASNENGYLGGMMVSYPFRDIEPSTVNDCFRSDRDETCVDMNVRFCHADAESRLTASGPNATSE